MNREDGVEYKGFAAPGKNPIEKVLVEGKALERRFDFGQLGGTPLLVKVALSAVSEDGALANLDEMPGWDFDAERATRPRTPGKRRWARSTSTRRSR